MQTNTKGEVKFHDLHASEGIDVSANNYASDSKRINTSSDITIAIKLNKGCKIIGRLQTGLKLKFILVRLSNNQIVNVDPDGKFVFSNVEPGEYTFILSYPFGYKNSKEYKNIINITDEEVKTIELIWSE